MNYNDKDILVNSTACISGIEKGDIIRVKSTDKQRGIILSVNGKPYEDIVSTWKNHEWAFPILDGANSDWVTVTDNPKAYEYPIGAVVIFGYNTNNAQYIGKYNGRVDKVVHGKYFCHLDRFSSESSLSTINGEFHKVVRIPTEHEYKMYVQALDRVLTPPEKPTFTDCKVGDIVIVKSSHVRPQKEFIGRFVKRSGDTIYCNPWCGVTDGNFDKTVQTHDGGFHEVVRLAKGVEVDRFNALTGDKPTIPPITQFVNSWGKIIKNGDWVENKGVRGEIYIAKNAEERVKYMGLNSAFPVYWILGHPGANNCPLCVGENALIYNDEDVIHCSEGREIFDKKAIQEQRDRMDTMNHGLYNPCREIPLGRFISDEIGQFDFKNLRPKTPDECYPPTEKHQKPVSIGKTKKKKHSLIIITK